MCSKVRCRTCGKTTWAGCGAHVDQVMRDVPAAERCTCSTTKKQQGGAASAPAKKWFGLF